MSDSDRSAARSPESLATLLRIRRNVLAGLLVGVALALGAYLVRVFELLGPFAGTQAYPLLGAGGWFLLLAFVLATTTAMLVAAVLTLATVVRVARSSDDGE